MKLVLLHARAATLELLRYPTFSVPTLAFPALFFLLFVAPRSDTDADPTRLLASFAGFAVLGVSFFQFGVGIAAERESSWERFVRTLPVRLRVRFAARVLSAALFGLASAALVAVTAVATTDAALSPPRWIALAAALALGALPFALLGIALGYWASPRSALPTANVLYLVLAFLGGAVDDARAPAWLRRTRLAVRPDPAIRERSLVGGGRTSVAPAGLGSPRRLGDRLRSARGVGLPPRRGEEVSMT